MIFAFFRDSPPGTFIISLLISHFSLYRRYDLSNSSCSFSSFSFLFHSPYEYIYILEPPSYSAAVEKMGMKEAIYSLAKRLNFILMFFVFSITLGAALSFSGKDGIREFGFKYSYIQKSIVVE